jgi:hypothetical protein
MGMRNRSNLDMLGLPSEDDEVALMLRERLLDLGISTERLRPFGIDPNSLSVGPGWKPSHWCVLYGRTKCAASLVCVRIDMTAKNGWNLTPVELAEFLLSNVLIILQYFYLVDYLYSTQYTER